MKFLDVFDLRRHLIRHPTAHKGDAGKVLLIGGAPTMAGALVLAGQGALYSGAGWVVLMMLDSVSAHVLAKQPELMVHDAQAYHPEQAFERIEPDVIAIGPGLGTSEQAATWLKAALSWQGPLVIDADALNLLASTPSLLTHLQNRTQPTTLTPHPGEAARLLGCSSNDIQSNREQSVLNLVTLTQSIVVLKGHATLIASPSQEVLECQHGNAGMAVGGTGDVLTGCIAALAGQGIRHQLDLWQASCLGVQLHAMAGDYLVQHGTGPIGLTPQELALAIRIMINIS